MMYLESMGFNSIARLLGVSHVAVIKWIKKYGSPLAPIKNDKPISVIEIDELHAYVLEKKRLAVVIGTRDTSTGVKLWDKIPTIPAEVYYTKFLPQEKHK